jgi:cell division protein ZapE
MSTSSATYRKQNLKGVYLYGGVGSGKTFVMDMFFKTSPTTSATRMHFSKFMLMIHQMMAKKQEERKAKIDQGLLARFLPKIHNDIGGTAGGTASERSFSFFGAKIVLSSGDGEMNAVDTSTEDPLPEIARELVAKHFLFCLDEFEVTDVADAFILARLVPALFEEGAVIVTTSNRAPSDLYHDGLNRHVFLPAIETIKNNSTVVSLQDSDTDYRVVKSAASLFTERRFIVGDKEHFEQLWDDKCGGESAQAVVVKRANMTRTLAVPHAVGKVCRFTFKELFENPSNPMGSSDFALLAEEFDTVFVTDMRGFNSGGHSVDGLRRMVLMIDSCYDAKVEMFFESSCKIEDLWDSKKDIEWGVTLNSNGDLLGTGTFVPVDTFTRFSLDRSISRLLEMTSDDYVAESRERREGRGGDGDGGGSGAAAAAAKMGLMTKGFQAADLDGNGMLDRDEVLALLRGMEIVIGRGEEEEEEEEEINEQTVEGIFEKYDVDSNNLLDKMEFQAYVKDRLQKRKKG